MKKFLLLVLLLLIGCVGLPRRIDNNFEDTCIKGRLSVEGAKYLREHPEAWNNVNDEYPWDVSENDRILRGKCSEKWNNIGMILNIIMAYEACAEGGGDDDYCRLLGFDR